jgi:hypothetical protein
MRRVRLRLSLALAAGLASPAAADEPPARRRPDIVRILADDLGDADVTAGRGDGPSRSRPGLLSALRKLLERPLAGVLDVLSDVSFRRACKKWSAGVGLGGLKDPRWPSQALGECWARAGAAVFRVRDIKRTRTSGRQWPLVQICASCFKSRIPGEDAQQPDSLALELCFPVPDALSFGR